jgi:hypothetical protein
MVKIHQKKTKIQLIRQSERKVNTNYVIDLGRAMHLLPVLQKAWVGSICIHNQGRCELLSPGRKKGYLQFITYMLRLQAEGGKQSS